MKPSPRPTVACAICLHDYDQAEITLHHLVPKSRGGRLGPTIPLCRACHGQVHALFTEKELERDYPTLELLLAAEPMQPWLRFIRKRKPTSRIGVRTSQRKRDRKGRR